MQPLELLATASAFFASVVEPIEPADWTRSTPCDEWDLGALVDHVIGGNRYTAHILAGAESDEAMRSAIESFQVPMERQPAVGVSLQAQRNAFSVEGALELVCHHEVGDVPGARVLEMRITDLTLHGWDVATAMGADATLAPELVRAAWSHLEPIRGGIARTGSFGQGPSGRLQDDAPLQDRLLDLSGRRV